MKRFSPFALRERRGRTKAVKAKMQDRKENGKRLSHCKITKKDLLKLNL
jgi:hypothetical protein